MPKPMDRSDLMTTICEEDSVWEEDGREDFDLVVGMNPLFGWEESGWEECLEGEDRLGKRRRSLELEEMEERTMTSMWFNGVSGGVHDEKGNRTRLWGDLGSVMATTWGMGQRCDSDAIDTLISEWFPEGEWDAANVEEGKKIFLDGFCECLNVVSSNESTGGRRKGECLWDSGVTLVVRGSGAHYLKDALTCSISCLPLPEYVKVAPLMIVPILICLSSGFNAVARCEDVETNKERYNTDKMMKEMSEWFISFISFKDVEMESLGYSTDNVCEQLKSIIRQWTIASELLMGRIEMPSKRTIRVPSKRREKVVKVRKEGKVCTIRVPSKRREKVVNDRLERQVDKVQNY
jgi:hypothetical protein